MINEVENNNSAKPNFFNKFNVLNHLPSFSKHMEQLKQKEISPKQDLELQQLYDNANITENTDNYYNLLMDLQNQNIESPSPTFASGQNSYFNKQIDSSGFEKPLKLHEQDIEDARFIAGCFNKTINYGNNNVPILYTTLPGTTEFNYAQQTFPAGIYEDVFQESANHGLSINPLVDEPEDEYWQRVLSEKISSQNLPVEKASEVLARGKRFINNFCHGKNRIYFIPINDMKQNKASFGDIAGLRDNNLDENSVEQVLSTLPTLDDKIEESNLNNTYDFYQNPNYSNEYGVVIYGPIKSKEIKYIEVDRAYDIFQKQAKANGLKAGEAIITKNMVF